MAKDVDGLVKHFIAGGFGGMCLIVTGYPLDTIKLRLQTQKAALTADHMYKGMMDCAKKTYFGEGFLGFYKGMLAPLAMAMPVSALGFSGYALGKKLQTPSGDNGTFSLLQVFGCGVIGCFCQLAITPACDRVKCLLQVQKLDKNTARYSGLFDCVRQSFKEGGLFRGVYKGTLITAIRDCPGMGLYFLSYEAVTRSFKSHHHGHTRRTTTFAEVCIAGGCAGFGYWIYAIVPDTVKSRLQTAPEGMYPNGMRDVIRDIWRSDGLAGFFRGFTPVLVRAMPSCAAQFIGFEAAMKVLHDYF